MNATGRMVWAAALAAVLLSGGWWEVSFLEAQNRSRVAGGNQQRRTSGRRPASSRTKKSVRIPVRPVSPGERRAAEQRAAELKQWNRDLAHWRRVLAADPDDEERQRALFHLGAGYAATGKWAAAAESLETLLQDFPKSLWRADVLLELIDLKLLREGDLPGARGYVTQAVAWADAKFQGRPDHPPGDTREQEEPPVTAPVPGGSMGRQPADARRGRESTSVDPEANASGSPNLAPAAPLSDRSQKSDTPAVGTPVHLLEPRTEQAAAYAVYRRAALLAYLDGERPAARLYFRKAGRRPPPGSSSAEAGSLPDVALERLLDRVRFLVRTRGSARPKEIREGDADAAALLTLADLLLAARDFERPAELCTRVIGRKDLEPSDVQLSYAHLLRGRCHYADRDDKQRKQARGEFLASQRLAPRAEWAGEALFLAANTWWNLDRKADEAVELWTRVIAEYPEHRQAPRAAYYIGIAHELSDQPAAAAEVFEALKLQFPDSPYIELADEHLKELARKSRLR